MVPKEAFSSFYIWHKTTVSASERRRLTTNLLAQQMLKANYESLTRKYQLQIMSEYDPQDHPELWKVLELPQDKIPALIDRFSRQSSVFFVTFSADDFKEMVSAFYLNCEMLSLFLHSLFNSFR